MEDCRYESYKTKNKLTFRSYLVYSKCHLVWLCSFKLIYCATMILKHGKLHFQWTFYYIVSVQELKLRQSIVSTHSPVAIMPLSKPHKSPQWAYSNKVEAHPVVQRDAWGSSHTVAPTTAMLNHLKRHPSISANLGVGLTKLARQHLCKLLGNVTEREYQLSLPMSLLKIWNRLVLQTMQ